MPYEPPTNVFTDEKGMLRQVCCACHGTVVAPGVYVPGARPMQHGNASPEDYSGQQSVTNHGPILARMPLMQSR